MVFLNLVISWLTFCCRVPCVIGVSAFCLGNCGGGRLSLFVGYPSANPSSRRKEKASRTEKFCWLLGVAFNLNLPSRHKT
jgi:hypothetical protein